MSCSGGSLLLVCVGLLGKKQVGRRERPLRTIICGIGRRAAAREVARRLFSDEVIWRRLIFRRGRSPIK